MTGLGVESLRGGRVADAVVVGGTAVLIVEAGGRVLQVECWRDPEGNGPGHLDVSVIKGARPGGKVEVVA